MLGIVREVEKFKKKIEDTVNEFNKKRKELMDTFNGKPEVSILIRKQDWFVVIY